MANANFAEQQEAELRKPKVQIAIEHLDQAFEHMNRAMQILSSVIFDLQKGADFIGRYRDSLVKSIEETGGDVTQSIESQIKEFIPKNYRPPQPEKETE